MQRRLTTILAADVVGFSRLIRNDEEGTLRALAVLRAEVIDARITAHGGRIFKAMGDGLLAEFPSVVEAVRASASIQREMVARYSDPSAMPKMQLRIGVNLGDVVVEGDDLLGDGVNVASRLEGICDPGGMCISASVRDHVRDVAGLVFEDLGKREVKNLDRPVHVWRWVADRQPGRDAGVTPSNPESGGWTRNLATLDLRVCLRAARCSGSCNCRFPDEAWCTDCRPALDRRHAVPEFE